MPGVARAVGIAVQGLSKTFGSGQSARPVLEDIVLRIAGGEVVSIRGDNGCGKTTLLNIIAGIETPTSGHVEFSGPRKGDLRIGYVQQDYTSSLLPWYNVAENVGMPLRLGGVPPAACQEKAQRFLIELGFGNLPTDAFPHELSGGQKQKVAVARALIHDPHLLLLDEPYANLDAHTRRDLEQLLSFTHEQTRRTILYVSHELDACITLADRVITIHGTPSRVAFDFPISLARPRNRELLLTKDYAKIRGQILAEEEALYGKRL